MIRIGTWNLQGASSRQRVTRQVQFMSSENCDVWLLTEVPSSFEMAPGRSVFSTQMGRPTRAFAAVWAKADLAKLDSIHPAAAFATVGAIRVCSCVLPWRAATPLWPDEGDLAEITQTTIERLGRGLTEGSGALVWGGDWNHALQGRDYVGTRAGRSALGALMTTLDLNAPTSSLPHRAGRGLCTIDHIAVPNAWTEGCIGGASPRTMPAD